MPTKHVDDQIEAYLNGHLTSEDRKTVEAHLRKCPICARLLFDTQRLKKELGPVMHTVLGHPTPPPMLRQRVRAALHEQQRHQRWFQWDRFGPLRFLSAAGNAALVVTLAFGAYLVIRSQLDVDAVSVPIDTAKEATEVVVTASPTTLSLQPPVTLTSPPTTSLPRKPSSTPTPLGDTIPVPTPTTPPVVTEQESDVVAVIKPDSATAFEQSAYQPSQPPPIAHQPKAERPLDAWPTTVPHNQPRLPGGTIAYALYDTRPERELFTTFFISPDGTHQREYSLRDVSEPALHPNKAHDYTLALRSWSQPDHPQKLLVSPLDGTTPQRVSPYWEDAQPDWAPGDDRVIYASQRESDRHWGLYTARGDGTQERNLRRAGRSPSFSPDNNTFVFEGCDLSGNDCGLWVGDLETVEYEARPLHLDPQAKSPDWSPKGNKIVYISEQDGNWDLYTVDSDGSNVTRLTFRSAVDGLPTWSPDGEWVAFVSDHGQGWGLWAVHVETRLTKQITEFEDYYTLTPKAGLPYNLHAERHWWDEQLSWSSY